MSSNQDTTLIRRFFLKGEELEATEYANVPFDDPALVSSRLPFKSFDRVPRYRRAPYVVAFLAFIVLGVESWYPTRTLVNENPYVQAAARATVRAAAAAANATRAAARDGLARVMRAVFDRSSAPP